MDRSSKTTSELVDDEATCRDCGKTFPFKRLVIDGERTPFSPGRCEDCCDKDEETVVGAPAPSHKGRILVLMDEAGVNVRQHGRCTLTEGTTRGKHFDSSECGPEPLEAATQFVYDMLNAGRWGSVQGLLLMGTLGSGKTHLAAAIVRAALLDKGIDPARVIFDRADRLITEIQDTYGTGGTSAILERRERAQLLVIDDLGREKARPDTLRILVDLVNAREGHPTVITSNQTPDGLVNRFGKGEGWQRLASRLGPQNFRHVTVQGHDRRSVA